MSPTFRYTAKNWEGKTAEGTHTAGSQREALEYLRGQNLFVLSLKEQAGSQAKLSLLDQLRESAAKKKPKSRDFMVFCRQFATMLHAGMTVLHIVKVQATQMEHPGFQDRLKDVAITVEKGGSLSEGFNKHGDFFPTIIIAMVEAGEAGGILDRAMDRLAEHFEKQHDLESKIRSATSYPIVITIVAALVMLLMVFFVLPQFASIFTTMGVELPFITKALLGVADFVIQNWYLVIAALALAVLALLHYLRTDRGREVYDRFRLKVPIFGPVYNMALVARFSRTLSTLMTSGVGLLPSLELVEKVIGNTVFIEAMDRTRQVIRQGQSMALPLAASGIFPPMLVEMVNLGEETGTLDDMLSRSADFYEGEVTFVLDRLSSIIEPVMLVAIGVFVGFLVVSIITPLFQVYEMIQ